MAKRYAPEPGSDTAVALAAEPGVRSVCTYPGYAETCAALRRKFNSGRLSSTSFADAREAIRREVLLNPDVLLLGVGEDDVLAGIQLSDRHNINSSDAAILATYLRFAHAKPEEKQILVASDLRLLRAAAAEGLNVLNPETVSPADLVSLI